MTDKFSVPESSHASVFPPYIVSEISLIHEQHPNIGKKITQLWGSVELHPYLNSIIFDERGGRRGFPEATATALFKVLDAHKMSMPAKKEKDIWDVILDRLE